MLLLPHRDDGIWRSHSTVPDGRAVLAFAGRYLAASKLRGGWVDQTGRYMMRLPTHWAPLPTLAKRQPFLGWLPPSSVIPNHACIVLAKIVDDGRYLRLVGRWTRKKWIGLEEQGKDTDLLDRSEVLGFQHLIPAPPSNETARR